MKFYENPEDLRIYAIVEVRKRGKMGIIMTGTDKQDMRGTFNRMCAARTKRMSKLSFLVFSVFSPNEPKP
jgi:hypothetical protein